MARVPPPAPVVVCGARAAPRRARVEQPAQVIVVAPAPPVTTYTVNVRIHR